MRKCWLVLAITVIFTGSFYLEVFGFLTLGYADELSELKEQLKATQKQMQEQAKAIEAMQVKIEQLEAEKTKTVEIPAVKLEAPRASLFVKIGEGDAKISGLIQALYRHYQLDSSNDAFSIPRARFILDGHAAPDWAYRLQIDAAASSSILRDAYIQYEKYPWAKVLIGQTFIPFSEDQLYPTTKLDFIDFSYVTSTLSYDRDIGVQARGELLDSKIIYGAGVFNGAGKNTADNNDSKDFVGRVIFTPFKGSKAPISGFSFGPAFQYGRQALSGNNEGGRAIADWLFKYEYKSLRLQSEYIFRRQGRIPGLKDLSSDGLYLMGAYYLIPKKLQAVLRYEYYDPDKNSSRDIEQRLTPGLNYFFNEYVKLQLNYIAKFEQEEAGNDELAAQLQVQF